MPRTHPTTRRWFRLLLAAAALLSVLVTAAPASAVVRPANINDTMDCSAHLCFSVKFDGILGWNVKQLAAWLPDANRKGHFEFFGRLAHRQQRRPGLAHQRDLRNQRLVDRQQRRAVVRPLLGLQRRDAALGHDLRQLLLLSQAG